MLDQFIEDAAVLGVLAKLKATARSFPTAADAALVRINDDVFYTRGRTAENDGGDAKYTKNRDGVVRPGDIVDAGGKRFLNSSAWIDPRMTDGKADYVWLANATLTAGSAVVNFSAVTNWAGFTQADADAHKVIGFRAAGAATHEYGYVNITALPIANDTLVIGGVTLTFKAGTAAGVNQMNISADVATMASDLAAFLTTNTATYAVTATAVNTLVKIIRNTAGAGSGSVTLSSTPGNLVKSPRVECLQNCLFGGLDKGWHYTTIATYVNAFQITVTNPAVFAAASTAWGYGTNNDTALANASLLATDNLVSNTVNNLVTNGRFPNMSGQGDAQDGTRKVVIRSLGRGVDQGRFGVLSEFVPTSGASVEFDGFASIAALPGFTGDAIMGLPSDGSCFYNKFRDVSLEGMTFADRGLWLRSGSSIQVLGFSRIFSTRLAAYELGYAGDANLLKSSTFDYFWGDWYQFNTARITGTSLNVPAGCGVIVNTNVSDCMMSKHMTQGWRGGWKDYGSASLTVTDSHVWTARTNGGMQFAYDLRSDTSSFSTIYADSPSADAATDPARGGALWDPTADQANTYAFIMRGYTQIKERAKVYLNSQGNDIANAQCTVFKIYYQGAKGELVVPELMVGSDDVAVACKTDVDYTNATNATTLLAIQNFALRHRSAPSTAIATLAVQTLDRVTRGYPYISGRYYEPEKINTAAAGTALTAKFLMLFRAKLRRAVRIDRFVARISTLSVGGLYQVGMYSPDEAGLPGTFITSSASQSTTTAGAFAFAPTDTDHVVPEGNVWFGTVSDNAVAAFTSVSNAGQAMGQELGFAGSGTHGSSGLLAGYSVDLTASAFGTWPADLTGYTFNEVTSLTVPFIGFRAL